MFSFYIYVLDISSKLFRDHVPLFKSIISKRYTLTNGEVKIFDSCIRTHFSYPSYQELCDIGMNQTKIN
jgi:hypothetical protein